MLTERDIQKILLKHCRYIVNINNIPITGIQTRQTTEIAKELFELQAKTYSKEIKLQIFH